MFSHTFVTSGSKTNILNVNEMQGTYKYIYKSIVTSWSLWLLRAIEIHWKVFIFPDYLIQIYTRGLVSIKFRQQEIGLMSGLCVTVDR